MASLRTLLLRPARRALLASPQLKQTQQQQQTQHQAALRHGRRPLSTTPHPAARVSSAPPVDPVRKASDGDLGVGELEGHDFKIEPMRRVGEDERTMRARLVYQSRKRGILESDLLLSTFADLYLPGMGRDEMAQYDRFLDENDWDIYYWATQELPGADAAAAAAAPASESPAEGGAAAEATGTNAAAAAAASSEEPYRKPGEGEWAQTIGTFKPAYRPVPARWRDSDVLRLLREHVKRRSKGGEQGGGMGFMPNLRDQ